MVSTETLRVLPSELGSAENPKSVKSGVPFRLGDEVDLSMLRHLPVGEEYPVYLQFDELKHASVVFKKPDPLPQRISTPAGTVESQFVMSESGTHSKPEAHPIEIQFRVPDVDEEEIRRINAQLNIDGNIVPTGILSLFSDKAESELAVPYANGRYLASFEFAQQLEDQSIRVALFPQSATVISGIQFTISLGSPTRK